MSREALQKEYFARCARFGIKPVSPCDAIHESYEKFIECLNQALKVAEEMKTYLENVPTK